RDLGHEEPLGPGPDLPALRAATVRQRPSPPELLGGTIMRETHVTLPELALIAGTRAALGAGLGLLLADRLPEGQRKAVGWTLVLIGALSTIPLAFEVLGESRLAAHEGWRNEPESAPETRGNRLMTH